MVTISHIVEKIINERPLLCESLIEGIVSHALLAEKLHPEIQKELGKKVNHAAIVMAIRRHSEKISHPSKKFKIKSDILMKTGLIDITVRKDAHLFEHLERIQKIIDYSRGDSLNILQGNYETNIITNEKYKQKILDVLKKESVVNIEEQLVSLTITVSEKFMNTPGVLANITRTLAWDNVNIYDLISTLTEIHIIVSKEDSVKCYNSLQKIME